MTADEEEYRPVTAAFLRWFAKSNLDNILRPEPRADRDAVDLHFLVGDGALEGFACNYDLSVAAVLRGESWDLVYTDEIAEEQSHKGWRCSLCLDDLPKHYPSLEQLWIGHLFRPFGQWCNEKLRAAPGVAFYGDTGMSWAKLEHPDDDAAHFQPLGWTEAHRINR